MDPLKLRRALGLTQEAMAVEVGVSVRTYSRWETGDARPRSRVIVRRLAELAGVARRLRLATTTPEFLAES